MVLPDSDLGHQLPVVTTGPESPGDVTMRIFGSLRPECDALGLPSQFRLTVPAEGVTGATLATTLGLPAEKIEGIFINRVVRPISDLVRPGDRVAFVPYDTPGPHRFFLGIYAAGKSGHDEASDDEGNSK